MARALTESNFYHTNTWKRARDAFMESNNWTCALCGMPAKFTHHIVYMDNEKVNDPFLATGWDNLLPVCGSCHYHIHQGQLLWFDDYGDIVEASHKIMDAEEVNQYHVNYRTGW
jgi:hypothetical protein